MAHDRRLTVYGASPDMDGRARVGRLSGYEHLPPVSVPFRHFLSRLTCWAPAQRRSLGAKNSRKLPAHRCFAVSAEQIWAEARRRLQGILLYFQGLERSISPNLPAKTGRGSNPLSLRGNSFCGQGENHDGLEADRLLRGGLFHLSGSSKRKMPWVPGERLARGGRLPACGLLRREKDPLLRPLPGVSLPHDAGILRREREP